jgi:streptogrisin C
LADDMIDRVSEIGALHPELSLTVADVGASWPQLEGAAMAAVLSPEYAEVVTGAAPDVVKGGILVDVIAASGEDASSPPVSAEQIEAAVGLPVELRIVTQKAERSTRTNDTSPYYGGARLNYGTTGYCSAGVPIKTGGVTRLLTAGHCPTGIFTNNGTTVGMMYTTSLPGNAHIYGDFQLLGSTTSSYGSRVFSGVMSSSSSLAITGGNWTNGSVGQAVCVSGATTAQTCRYYATNWGRITDFNDGIMTYPLVEMRHDSTGGSGYDSNGFLPGDSGGPCYWSDGNGGVIATGIVTGGLPNAGGTTAYFCSQLKGVRAWNSGAVIP